MSTPRCLVEEMHGGEQYRLRAWLHAEFDTVVEFEVAHCFNVDDWQVEARGSFRFDDCANFEAGCDGTLAHTCGFDGFVEWVTVLARIPEMVKQVRRAKVIGR